MSAPSSSGVSSFEGPPSPSPTPEHASQPVSHLDSEWVVNNLSTEPPRSLKAAFDAAAQNGSGVSSGTESASEEDYDVLKQDPLALIQDGRGNVSRGISTEIKPSPLRAQDIKTTTRIRPGPLRVKSIPITLSKLNEKGKYILTADDKDLKEILRLGLERVSSCTLVGGYCL